MKYLLTENKNEHTFATTISKFNFFARGILFYKPGGPIDLAGLAA